ncbi:MAG TPA: extracellular solute-binding protein, partial [Trueperaceae bacterium]|nr:extracellular solute-binding protein [Trueperaceae bacterium]
TPLVIGENWTVQHLWESVAVAEMGPDGWRGLWDGSVAFDSPEAQAVWETFDKVLACTNADFTGLSWQQATDRVANGQAAFNVMGDWAAGYMATTLGLEPGTGFAWAASPGTDGVFILLADSFGLPKGAPDRDNALAWLELVGSKKGQDIFNPLKGSISPRLDSDLSKYNAYGKSAAADYQSDTQVGSLVHGAVANETFMSDFATVMETFLSNRDAAEAASLAAELAGRAHIGN